MDLQTDWINAKPVLYLGALRYARYHPISPKSEDFGLKRYSQTGRAVCYNVQHTSLSTTGQNLIRRAAQGGFSLLSHDQAHTVPGSLGTVAATTRSLRCL